MEGLDKRLGGFDDLLCQRFCDVVEHLFGLRSNHVCCDVDFGVDCTGNEGSNPPPVAVLDDITQEVTRGVNHFILSKLFREQAELYAFDLVQWLGSMDQKSACNRFGKSFLYSSEEFSYFGGCCPV